MRRILAWCREWQALFGFLCMIFALIGLFPETKLSIPLQQLPEVFSPWLYVVMALIGALLLFLHIAPTLRSGADWLFRPAVVGSPRRRLHNLLPEVEWCLNAVKEDYKYQASVAGQIYNVVPPPLGLTVRFTQLKSRLGRLCSKLDGLGVPVPDPVRINSLGELSDMVEYLARLQDCVSACDLGAARKIDPP